MYELTCLASVLAEYVKGFVFDFLDIYKFIQFAVCNFSAGIIGSMISSKSSFSQEGRLLTAMLFGVIWLTIIIIDIGRGLYGQYWLFWTFICLYWSISMAWLCYMYTENV